MVKPLKAVKKLTAFFWSLLFMVTVFNSYLYKTLKRLLLYLPFLLGLASGIVFTGLNLCEIHLTFFPGDLIDARFNTYLLEHGYLFLRGDLSNYWNAPFMFPEENVITYSDNLLGTVPLYALFRAIGADRETAFQYWFLLLLVLNYTACFVFIKNTFHNNYAAALGAFVFAFSMSLQSQMGHAQTFARFAIPISVGFFLRFSHELKPKYLFFTLLAWTYQMYCGIYLGFMLLVLLGLLFLIHFILNWRDYKIKLKDKKWLVHVLASSSTCILLLLPLLLPYFERAKQLGFHSYETVHQSILTPASFLFSWNGSLFWNMLNEICIEYPAFWDHEIFGGGIALLSLVSVLIIGVYHGIRKKTIPAKNLKILFLAGIFLFLIFMRFGNYSLYRILYAIPGFGSMRALQRIINIELLFFALSCAWLVTKLFPKNNIASSILFLTLLLTLTLDNYVPGTMMHRHKKTDSQKRVASVINKIQAFPKNKIVSYEPDTLLSSPMDYQLDAMLASQSKGFTTLNGYSATSPGGYGNYWVNPCEESRLIWLERKKTSASTIVVVH